MQNLVVLTTCDIESIQGLDAEEATEVFWFVHGEPWVVDMCKRHRTEVTVNDMDDVVVQYGRPASERKRIDVSAVMGQGMGDKPRSHKKKKPPSEAEGEVITERVPCPWPGCEKDSKNRGALLGHFYRDHKIRLPAWEARQRGDYDPVYCACGEEFTSVRALGSHIHSTEKKEEEKGRHYEDRSKARQAAD